MNVSVVVCTLNRAALLPRLLQRLRPELGQDDEVIVVDNGSTDDTGEVVARAAAGSPKLAIRYVAEPEQGLSHARNCGILEAKGEIVAFLDDDALPQPGWLAAHRRHYEQDARVGAVGGPIELLFEAERPSWLTGSFEQLLGRYDLGGEAKVYGGLEGSHTPSGGNMSFRRSALAEVGPFDVELGRSGDDFLAGEEYDLAHRLFRAGWQAVYEPAAAARHLVPAERLRIRFFRQRMRWNLATGEQLDERSGFQRLSWHGDLRHLFANIARDSALTLGSHKAGDRLYYLLRLEADLIRARKVLKRTARALRPGTASAGHP